VRGQGVPGRYERTHHNPRCRAYGPRSAHRLGEIGYEDWAIHERADHVGGLASSWTDPEGFIWDHGGHVMFSHYHYFDDLVEKMLRGDYDQHMR
jgi:hypothetical protein